MMSSYYRTLIIACTMTITILSAASCTNGDARSSGFTVADSAGVKIVRHGYGDLVERSGHPGFLPTPSVQIGSRDQDGAALYRVTDVARMPNGQIAVANSGTGEVKLFDSGGRFLHSLGGLGDGPGEFRQLSKLGISADGHVLAYDSQTDRITVFDAESGAVVETTTLTVTKEQYDFGSMRHAWAIGWLRDGRFMGYYNTPLGALAMEDGWTKQEWMSHIHFFDDGKASDILTSTRGRQRWLMISNLGGGRTRVQRIANPFESTLETDTDGELVAYGNTRRFDISIMDGNSGVVVRIVRRVDDTRLATGNHREAWISSRLEDIGDDGTERARRRMALYENMPFPDTLPAFETLVLQQGGRLWVKEASFDDPTSGSREWSVFDREGYPIGTVEMQTDFRPFEIGNDYVLGVWTDDLGVEYVHMYDIIGESS